VTATRLIEAWRPLGVGKMKWNPAIVASPARTPIADITGPCIFFTVAQFHLGI